MEVYRGLQELIEFDLIFRVNSRKFVIPVGRTGSQYFNKIAKLLNHVASPDRALASRDV